VSRKHRILRTGLAGLVATTVDVTTMVALVELCRLPVGIAAFLGAVAGAKVGFLISKYWAFRDDSPIAPRQVGAYAGVALGTAVCVALVVTVLSGAGLPYLAAKAIASISTFVCWSYPAQSRLVFRPRSIQ